MSAWGTFGCPCHGGMMTRPDERAISNGNQGGTVSTTHDVETVGKTVTDLRDIITYNGRMSLYAPEVIVQPDASGEAVERITPIIAGLESARGRYLSVDDAITSASQELREKGVDLSEVTVRSRTVQFFGTNNLNVQVTPWTIVNHLCSCIPGTLAVVSRFVEDFSDWLDENEGSIENAEDVSSMIEAMEHMSEKKDWQDCINAINSAISSAEDAKYEATDNDDRDVEVAMDRALDSLNEALSRVREIA